jgi:hypothetical protein
MEPSSEIHYKRLARFRVRTGLSSLWLGPDHILSVNSNGYIENYKRFYFRDIQAIIVQRTSRRAVWNGILAAPLLGAFIGLLACLSSLSEDEVGAIICSVILVIILSFFILNYILGVGCACHIRTAVQIQRLPSVRRVPYARHVLETIRPLIAVAQGGELSAEVVSTRMRESIAPAGTVPPSQSVTENPSSPITPSV